MALEKVSSKKELEAVFMIVASAGGFSNIWVLLCPTIVERMALEKISTKKRFVIVAI